MSNTLKVCIGVMAVLAVFLVGNFLSAFNRASVLPVAVANKVLDGDEAIATYEWFKEQEAFINQCLTNEELTKTDYDEYAARLPEDMKEWTAFMSKEESALRASYNAHQKLTNKAIEDYNAKSSMVHKSIFKDLPTNIVRSTEDAFKLTFSY